MKQSKVDTLINSIDPTKFLCIGCKEYKDKKLICLARYYVRGIYNYPMCIQCYKKMIKT